MPARARYQNRKHSPRLDQLLLRDRFCSVACRASNVERQRPLLTVVCRCGVVFETKIPHRKHCSERCRRDAQPPAPWSEAKKAADIARRARKITTAVELLRPQEIFDRDGWRCHLCRRKVSEAKRYPDPRSASLDHIVPLALGGSHTADNVACAHLECNLTKGRLLRGHPLLFGEAG